MRAEIISASLALSAARSAMDLEVKLPLYPIPQHLLASVNMSSNIDHVRFRFLRIALRKSLRDKSALDSIYNRNTLLEGHGASDTATELWSPIRIILWCSRNIESHIERGNNLAKSEIAALTRLELLEYEKYAEILQKRLLQLKQSAHDQVKAQEGDHRIAQERVRSMRSAETQAFKFHLSEALDNYHTEKQIHIWCRYEAAFTKRLREEQSLEYIRREQAATQAAKQKIAALDRNALVETKEYLEFETMARLNQKQGAMVALKEKNNFVKMSRAHFRHQGSVLLALSKQKNGC